MIVLHQAEGPSEETAGTVKTGRITEGVGREEDEMWSENKQCEGNSRDWD